MSGYLEGQSIAFLITITDLATDLAADPDNLSFMIKRRGNYSAVTLEYGVDSEITKLGVGSYKCVYAPADDAGMYDYRWWSTGSITHAAEGVVAVTASKLV